MTQDNQSKHILNNLLDLPLTECDDLIHLSSIEIWRNIENKELMSYSMHIDGINAILNKHIDLLKNGVLKLEFDDHTSDQTCYIEVDNELKNKILELIKQI